MSYLVLARKYRPQTFTQIVGQEHVTRTLANAFSQGRVHHAFLLCGPRGVGKTSAARVLGKALNCEKGPTADPCGACSACQTITSGSAVDYYEMDGASNRGIDSIRDLTEAVRYQPAVLRKKVYVIDEVHMLTTEAFNALLKTLEEPPPHVTFVLATTEPHKVPNTILSRCQRYDFKLVPAARLASHLTEIFTRESIGFEPAAINLIVRESGGSVRDALSLCDQVISYVGSGAITEATVAEVLGVADRALTRSLVTALAAGNAGAALEAVDAAVGRGVDEVQVARAIVRFLRDLAVVQAAPGIDKLVDGSAEEKADLAALAQEIDGSRVRQMFERMTRACEDLAESQQPRMVVDLALIDLAATEPMIPLGDLIDRLGDLERRLAGGRTPAPSGGGDKRPAPAPAARPAPSAPKAVQAAPAPVPAAPAPVQAAPVPVEPPPPPPAPKTPPGMGDLLEAWERVILGLDEAKELSLASVYQNARLLAWQPDRIEVGFAAGAMTSELAVEPNKVAQMKAFLERHLGRDVTFTVRLLTDTELADKKATKSILEAADERQRNEREARENEARQHPVTQHVLGTFNASIKEIKTDV